MCSVLCHALNGKGALGAACDLGLVECILMVVSGKKPQVPPVAKISSCPGKHESQLSGFLSVKILICVSQCLSVNPCLTSSLCHCPADISIHVYSHFPSDKVATGDYLSS